MDRCAAFRKGLAEARSAGKILKEQGFVFDKAYTSVLKRAIKTLWCVLEEMDLMWIPVENSWKLNERHYGGLQGLNKSETAAKYGDDQVKIWRRSYATRPPLLDKSDERHPEEIPDTPGFPITSYLPESALKTPWQGSCPTGKRSSFRT